MSCCNCCTNTLNLGCFSPCTDTFNTGIVVDPITFGDWSLQLDFGNIVQQFNVTVADGETVIFTLDNLNESYTYKGVIRDAFGDIVNITVGGIEYDCIEFSTKIGLLNTTINI